MSKPVLIATVGLPRSGKTTWAKARSVTLGCPVVSPDAIRLALHGQAFNARAEPFVWVVAKVMVRALFFAGHPFVILDATNTTRKRRDEWKDSDWQTQFRVIATSEEECRARACTGGREDLVPVIARMAAQWEPIGNGEAEY